MPEAYTGNTVGRRGDVPSLSNSAPLEQSIHLAMVLTYQKPTQRNRNGEIPEGVSESESVACSERSIRNLGDPSTSSIRGRTFQPKEGRPKGIK